MSKSQEWKQYVREAKLRLNDMTSVERKKEEEIFYLNTKRLTPQEVKRFEATVKEIVASDTFIEDPLGRMMNKEVFDLLSDGERMKYLLDLSTIYLKLRTKSENNA